MCPGKGAPPGARPAERGRGAAAPWPARRVKPQPPEGSHQRVATLHPPRRPPPRWQPPPPARLTAKGPAARAAGHPGGRPKTPCSRAQARYARASWPESRGGPRAPTRPGR
eukprot:7380888-Prymnesium_polylepis.1